MATLEKIRSKSALLLIFVGAGLLAFIIGDFFTSGRSLFGTGTTIAKVDDSKVDIQEFQRRVQDASQQAQAQNQRMDQAVLQQQVLNAMIAEKLFDQEVKDLGLTVTDQELTDMMVGKNSQYVDRMVQQQLGVPDAKTAHDMAFNPTKYGMQQAQAQQLQAYWIDLEKSVERMLLQQKFQNLFTGTLVANELDAKANFLYLTISTMRKTLLLLLTILSTTTFSVSGISPRAGVSILGDSYSTFEGHVTPDTNYVWYFKTPKPELTDVSDVSQTWWQQLIRDKNLRLEVNNSFSGATICNRGYRGEDYSDRSFLTRVKALGSPDIILVFGGTNDSWAGVEVGEYLDSEGKTADGSAPDLYTFRPALDIMLAEMKDYYPGTDIYFIVNTKLRPEITESIETLCRKHDIETIMLKDIAKKANHPSVKGMEEIARQVGERIK